MIQTEDTIYENLENIKVLSIKTDSKYMDYLEEIGKDDPFFKRLHDNFSMFGNLSAAYTRMFYGNIKNFDFNIPKNRIWAAIYLLNMEDKIEKKLERYPENK